MKLLFLLTVFCSSAYVGYITSKKYSKRDKFYNELLMLCNVLITNIRFNKNKLSIIINEFIGNCSNELAQFLQSYLDGDIEEISFLSKYDNRMIRDFFSKLGEFDSNGEIGYIENNKVYFNECYIRCVEDNKKYGALCSKMGFMVGLILVILLI